MIAEVIRGEVMDAERLWQAVMSRDAEADGEFVYAVRSTGVFCKPSCPSRRPQRRQVSFFNGAEEAVEAGYRPCKRCRPTGLPGDGSHIEIVERACRYIEENLDSPLTLLAIGEAVHVSPFHLQRTFKRVMGVTPRQYAETRRMERLKAQLKEGDSVTGAIYDAGYSSGSRLYEKAPVHLGMTPSTYRRGGVGMQIAYATTETSLGMLLAAATERGICAVSLGAEDTELEKALHREYPAAEIGRDSGNLEGWVSAIVAYIEGRQARLDLPLDLQATAFQYRVWEELKAIPYGATRSYGQVAAAIGQPTATRAVARACGTNPAALVIPCHRVVREDGSLGGYRWGVERKERLLAQERSAVEQVATF